MSFENPHMTPTEFLVKLGKCQTEQEVSVMINVVLGEVNASSEVAKNLLTEATNRIDRLKGATPPSCLGGRGIDQIETWG